MRYRPLAALEQHLRICDVAARLGGSAATVRRHIASGAIPARRLGKTVLIPVRALERALEREEERS